MPDTQCKRCGSYAVNPHLHGRLPNKDLDLCDVCYWRVRAENMREILELTKLAKGQSPKNFDAFVDNKLKESN